MLSSEFAPHMPPPSIVSERRDPRQASARQSGHLITITGTRAVISTRLQTVSGTEDPFWAVGSLITIYGPKSRIICFVKNMTAVDPPWRMEGENIAHAEVELMGEVLDEDGKPRFRRGISHYPPLGATAHRIRNEDLAAIYDLGGRKGSVIGTLTQSSQIAAAIDVEGLLKKHFAVVGTTGVGKSCSVSILLRAAIEVRPKLRVIIVDPHNEYTHAFNDVAHTVDSRAFELPFWLFRFEEILDVIYRGAKPPDDEVEFLRDAIMQAKDMYSTRAQSMPGSILKKTLRTDGNNAITADAPLPYRMTDIISLIDEHTGRLEVKFSRSSLRSLRARIESLSNDPSYRFMFGKWAIDGVTEPVIRQLFRLRDARKPITILQLAGIPADVVNASVSVLARMAFDLSIISHGNYEILLTCEEAHRYVPADANLGFAPTRRALARIAKEGRKYGCYLGIVTQRPSELDPTILSQCSTMFAMRLANTEDQDIIRSAMPDAATGVLEFLSALSNREALAFGEAFATPMRMMFAFKDPSHLPRMQDDEKDAPRYTQAGVQDYFDDEPDSQPTPPAMPDPMPMAAPMPAPHMPAHPMSPSPAYARAPAVAPPLTPGLTSNLPGPMPAHPDIQDVFRRPGVPAATAQSLAQRPAPTLARPVASPGLPPIGGNSPFGQR